MPLTDIDGQRLGDSVADKLGVRNLIINGAMQVAQRSTSVTGITSGGYKTVDRFKHVLGSLGTWTNTQESDGPDGFANSLKLTCTTADASPAASDSLMIQYRMEGQDLQQLAYGSSAAKQSTLSFYVKSNKTGNASVALRQPDASDRLYSAQYTISSANTWERKTIVVPADTSGTINDDNGSGLQCEWWMNSGSNYTGGSHGGWKTADDTSRNASNLGVGGAVNDYFEITGVQLEIGNTATPFEHRNYADELARCQRYCFRVNGKTSDEKVIGAGMMFDTNTAIIVVHLPVPMRNSNQTVTEAECQVRSGNSLVDASITASVDETETCVAVLMDADSGSPFTSGDGTLLRIDNTDTAFLMVDAEL